MIEELVGATTDEALVTLVVEEFQKTSQGHLGRTAIQKICYFAQSLGVPLNFEFKILYYGPYSHELASEVELLLASDVLEDTSKKPSAYSALRLGPAAHKLLETYPELTERYRPTVARVAAAFGELGPSTLELLSTLHFIDRRLRASGTEHPSRDEVVKRFQQVKQDRFSKGEIEAAYDAMRRAGLIG